MSCGVGLRHSSDLASLWLWRRPLATASIGPLVWEPPYAGGEALKKDKKPKKKKKEKKKKKLVQNLNLNLDSVSVKRRFS